MTVEMTKPPAPAPAAPPAVALAEPTVKTDDDGRPVLVDQEPEPVETVADKITARRRAKMKPVIPDWLRSVSMAWHLLLFFARYYLHVVAFHGTRALTEYQVKLLPRAPLGLYRLCRDIVNAMTDAEARPLRKAAVVRTDAREYLALKKERNEVIRRRAIAGAILAAVLVAVGVLVWLLAPVWLLAVLAFVAADLLGYYGRDYSTPVFQKAVALPHQTPVLRADTVEVALRSLTGMKRDAVIEFVDPIYRDGEGWMAKVLLPHGFTVTKVLNYKEELANGLRRPLSAVWPEGDEDNAGLLKLWVGFQAFSKMKMPPYPVPRGAADFFGSIPYGRTQRMAPISLCLFENNVILGAIPGAGKSAAVRTIGAGLALDPTVELRLWSLKQNDLAELERVSHSFGYGLTNDVLEACLQDMREVLAEIVRRTQVLSKVQKENRALCPDGKLTRQLASRRDLGLQPIVLVVDECQNLFQHEKYGPDACKIVLDIVRMGRAYGVVLVLATQRPDTNSLPKGISANVSIKICLRMTDHQAVDMVLGTGAHSRGLKAELFKDSEKGMGYILGVTNDDMVGRSYYLDGPATEKLVEKAHALREAEGRLTGHALQAEAERQEDQANGRDLLVDLEKLLLDRGIDWMWNVRACSELAVREPGAYQGLTPTTLGTILARRGVPTSQMNRVDPDGGPRAKRQNLTGFTLAAIQAARQGRGQVPEAA